MRIQGTQIIEGGWIKIEHRAFVDGLIHTCLNRWSYIVHTHGQRIGSITSILVGGLGGYCVVCGTVRICMLDRTRISGDGVDDSVAPNNHPGSDRVVARIRAGQIERVNRAFININGPTHHKGWRYIHHGHME